MHRAGVWEWMVRVSLLLLLLLLLLRLLLLLLHGGARYLFNHLLLLEGFLTTLQAVLQEG